MTSRERGRPPHPDVLTPAEWRVTDAVRHGLARRDIARRRGSSVDAVRFHLRNIGAKLGVAGSVGIRQWEGYPVDHPATEPGAATVAFGPVAQVSLFVRDVEEAVRFYGETLRLTHVFTVGSMAFFDVDGLRLYLHQTDEGEWRAGSVLYFLVPDIAAAYAHLQHASVTTSGAPHLVYTDPEGVQEWMAFFEDPDGNTLAVVSRVPSSATRFPAPP